MTTDRLSTPTPEFIAGIEAVAAQFDSATYPQQNLPSDDLAILVKSGVLLPSLPREYGGRESHVEMCRVIEAISEWNLPLGVHLMVITCVGLRPIVLFATDKAKQEVLPAFAGDDPMIAGFAATEPGCGSALSSMTTRFEKAGDGYRISGRKHWQALSMTAHWWVVPAKNTDQGRGQYGFFIVKRSEGFRTIQTYEPLGLKIIDYGLNEIDAHVPEYRRLQLRDDSLQPAAEILMASRSFMAAMATGFLRRLSREAHKYADNRPIGRTPLSAIRFARYRLKEIDASAAIAAALNYYLQTSLDIRGMMIGSLPAIHAIKTVATERMLSAALHYQQLTGGEGYRYGSPSNIAGQAVLDARVFPIFDGTNDLLSQQLAEHCLAKLEHQRLSDFLAAWPLTAPAVTAHRINLAFLDRNLGQEHLVLAGRVIAYAFAITQVMHCAKQTGVDAATARAAIEFLKADITRAANEFTLLDTGILEDPHPAHDGLVTSGHVMARFRRKPGSRW